MTSLLVIAKTGIYCLQIHENGITDVWLMKTAIKVQSLLFFANELNNKFLDYFDSLITGSIKGLQCFAI